MKKEYNKEIHVKEQLLKYRWRCAINETNHQTAEGEHFRCILLINESAAVQTIEEMKSHNKITQALVIWMLMAVVS
jgi:hypothetical protein